MVVVLWGVVKCSGLVGNCDIYGCGGVSYRVTIWFGFISELTDRDLVIAAVGINMVGVNYYMCGYNCLVGVETLVSW